MMDAGATNEMLGVSSSGFVGENDLLIVGPGVLGRMVAEKWQEVFLASCYQKGGEKVE